MLNLAPTGGPDDGVPELPDPFFRRLRALALSDAATDAQRARIRASLCPSVAAFQSHLETVAEACDGPDPETALLYLLDSAATMRAALAALDAALHHT